MEDGTIPDNLRRYLLTAALSVPHVEAILQLRANAPQPFESATLSARLYIRASVADALLSDLCALGAARIVADNPLSYAYAPATPELALILDELEDAYTHNLIAVTRLIHSLEEHKAHDFADAFRFRKEP